MQIPFTPLVVGLLAVVAQAVFAAGLLALARRNRLPNRFLALLMLAIALWLLDGFFRVANIYGQNANWYFMPIYYSLAFGPLLYFYVRSLVNHNFRFGARQLWHFGPVLAQAGLYWALRLQAYPARLWFWQHVHRPYTYRLEFIGTWVSLTVYLVLSLRLLRQYRRWLLDNFSEVSELRLRWLRVLLVLVAVVSGQWLLELVLREFFGLYYRYDYSTELLGVVVFLVGVVGLRQADMRAVRFTPETDPLAPPEAATPTGFAPDILLGSLRAHLPAANRTANASQSGSPRTGRRAGGSRCGGVGPHPAGAGRRAALPQPHAHAGRALGPYRPGPAPDFVHRQPRLRPELQRRGKRLPGGRSEAPPRHPRRPAPDAARPGSGKWLQFQNHLQPHLQTVHRRSPPGVEW